MPLAKFATFALAAFLAFGACAGEEDARVVRVTRNIGGRPGFQVHWDIWKATFERQNPDWTLELIDLGNEDAGAYYRRAIATGDLIRTIMANMIALLDNFVEKGSLSDGYNEEQRDFFNEHAATWMMGCWMSGDVEPLQVNFEIEYWPIPSMTGHQPLFINTSNQQRGWAMTSSAQGAYYEKSLAVLNAYYYPAVYQAYLNAEGMLLNATQIEGVDGPKSTWGPTQRLFERMSTNLDHWGWTPGYFISIEDYPPTGFVLTLARIMQEIQAGNRDIDALLKMLDDDWEAGRKGNK